MVKNISRVFLRAPTGTIWAALTEPALVKQWQYGSDLVTTWEVGTEIRFRAVWQDQVFEQWGTVLELIPGRVLRYSLFAPREGVEDRPENRFVMVYELFPRDGGAELVITQEDGRPGATAEPEQGDENPVLTALKRVVEGA
jgi:uncharacterized protein YndB with AHSA1/START domain